MDLKILSGILITKGHREGKVVVDLARNEIVESLGDLELGDLRQERRVAPSGMEDWYYDVNPCFTVSIRQIRVQDEDEHTLWAKPPTIEWDNFIIDTTVNQTRLTINWNAGGAGSEIEEISYMVIGTLMEPEIP